MYTPLKPKNKTLRVLFQLCVLLGAAGWVVYIAMERGNPSDRHPEEWTQKRGFLALSYGALSRTEDGPNLPRSMLRKHLVALRDNGYQAITVEDIVNYYENGALLPDKAVFIMFEGGRRDSAVFGQEALLDSGMRATIFVYTVLFRTYDRTFLTRSQMRAMGRSRYWDVGTSGHAIYLPAPGRTAMPDNRYFLADYRRLATGGVAESPGQYAIRAEEDYAESVTTLESLLEKRPLAYIFMPANTLGGSMDPAIAEINRRLIQRYFRIAFTREGVPYNHRGDNQFELSRMRIESDCTVEELLHRVGLWPPKLEPYAYVRGTAGEVWRREFGKVEFLDDAIRLVSGAHQPAFAVMLGSEGWHNHEMSVRIDPSQSERSLYLRYASRDSFLRITVDGDVMKVSERLPDHGLTVLFTCKIAADEPVNLSLLLRNNRLAVWLDGVMLTEYPIPVAAARSGRAALETVGAEAAATAAFGDISIKPLLPHWMMVETVSRELNASALLVRPGLEGLSTLLDAGNWGYERYALLPDGDISMRTLYMGMENAPAGLRRGAWTGVVFSPEGDEPSWAALRVSLAEAGRNGLRRAIRIDAEQAEKLAAASTPLPAEAVLVTRGRLSVIAKAALMRAYGTVLHADGDAFREETP